VTEGIEVQQTAREATSAVPQVISPESISIPPSYTVPRLIRPLTLHGRQAFTGDSSQGRRPCQR